MPVGLVALSILIVIALASIARGKRPEQKEEKAQAMLVEVLPAEAKSLNLTVVSQGSVRPRTETTVVAEVSGKVVEVSPHFIAGGFFRKDEVLLQIDPSDYQAALKRAQANLASRKAQLAEQNARAEQARKDWSNLGREGEASDLTLRKPQLAEAVANVQAAEADLEKAERDLQRTRIKVPYDGLVKTKQADIGQYVAPGTPLGVTFSVDTAEVRLPLSAADVSFLELPPVTNPQGLPLPQVVLSSETAGTSGQWQAEIIRTEGVIDEQSRVTYAVAQVVDPYAVLGLSKQAELRIGTFVRAEIQGRRAENVIVLPRSILSINDTVLVANNDDELEIRPVDIVRTEPEKVYIGAGISPGDLVITTHLDAPIAGTKLTISGRESADLPDRQLPDDGAIASQEPGQ